MKETVMELKELNQKLRWDNLKLRLEMEVLIDDINSWASQKILAKYRLKKAIREKADKAMKN